MSEQKKIRLSLPIIVEGKYDQIKLSAVYDGCIIRTDGFGVFSAGEKMALIRRMAGEKGVIVLTDPDGGGKVIRRYLSQALPPEKIYHLHVPRLAGKERRKAAPSKEGFLGVEGMTEDFLRELLLRFAAANGIDPEKGEASGASASGGITKADLYAWGLSGTPAASAARDALAPRLGLPTGMTPTAFLSAVNLLYTPETLGQIIEENETE